MNPIRCICVLAWLLAGLESWAQKPELVLPVGHSHSASSVAFSPDGLYMASLGGGLILWDNQGHKIREYSLEEDAISKFAFSPNGKLIVLGTSSGNIFLIDLLKKKRILLQGHNDRIHSISFSLKGDRILSSSSDNNIRLWDFSGRSLQTFSFENYIESDDRIESAQLIRNDKHILFETREGASIWDIANRRMIQISHSDWYRSNIIAYLDKTGLIITGGDDKAIRFWSSSGQLVKEIPECGYLEAISHSGLLFATSKSSPKTHLGNEVGIFSISGERIRNLEFSGAHINLSFSPNDKAILATGLTSATSGRGVSFIYNILGGTHIFLDHFNPAAGLGGGIWQSEDIQFSTFSPNGQLFLTVHKDGPIRIWSIDGEERRILNGNMQAMSNVTINQEEGLLAMGDANGNTRIWSLLDNKIELLKGHTRSIETIASSSNGQFICTGSEDHTARVWDRSGNEVANLQCSSYVEAVDFSPDGSLIVTGELDGVVQLWNLRGEKILNFKGEASQIYSVAYSPSGEYLLTGDSDNQAILWNLSGRKVRTIQSYEKEVRYDETLICALAFSPNGKLILTGSTNGEARIFDIQGNEIQVLRGHSSEVQSVDISPDGKYFLTGCIDGTARLWDITGRTIQVFNKENSSILEAKFLNNGKKVLTTSVDRTSRIWDVYTGKHLASFFITGSTDWIVTTPSGLFDATPAAMKLMHYVQGLEVIELTQLKDRYYEPDLFAKILDYKDEPLRNVSAFDQLDLYPKAQLNLARQTLTITLTPRSGGIGRVAFFIGDKEVSPDINQDRQTSIQLDLTQYQDYFSPSQPTQIGIKTWNADDWLVSNLETISYTPPKRSTQLSQQIRLFALCIGTSNYQGESFDLSFADQDAQKVAQAISEAGQSLLLNDTERIDIQVLSTANRHEAWPSKSNIQAAMQQIAKQARPEDLFVLYLSGHGTTNDRDGKDYFYYLTHELSSGNINDTEIRRQYAISTAEWADWLTAIPAQKQVMVLDACASGTFTESFDNLLASRDIPSSQIRALDRLRSRTGLFIISGSTADQVSYEASPYGQGLLTYSLLRGIKSGEALREGQYVDVLRLFDYAKETVPELAKEIGGIQEPMILSPYGSESYDIGRATPAVRNQIDLSEPKPIFCRVRLNNEATFDDDLGLEKVVNEQLRAFSKRGSKAPLIFVDVADDPNAYRIVGRYRVDGEQIVIQARVMRAGKVVGESFEVSGRKGAEEKLGQDLVRRAHEELE